VQKFKAFRKKNNLTQEEVAAYFGVKQSFISQIENNIRSIPESFISKLQADSIYDYSDLIDRDLQNKECSEFGAFVPLLPISAQGGSLNDFMVSVKDSECERVVSPVKGADFAITVAGDSMSPEYPSGSQIFIKKINENAFIDWGKVYVLDTCNGTVIKRIFPAEDNNPRKIKCVSVFIGFCYVCRLNKIMESYNHYKLKII
jgi:DNA-binding XRE family transcriptional regulator